MTPEKSLMMSDKRKKIIGVGLLIICIASMMHASNERESPSIGWMLALCATWGLIVWLKADTYPRCLFRRLVSVKWQAHWEAAKEIFMIVGAVLGGLLMLTVIVGQFNIGPFSKEKLEREEMERKSRQENKRYYYPPQGFR